MQGQIRTWSSEVAQTCSRKVAVVMWIHDTCLLMYCVTDLSHLTCTSVLIQALMYTDCFKIILCSCFLGNLKAHMYTSINIVQAKTIRTTHQTPGRIYLGRRCTWLYLMTHAKTSGVSFVYKQMSCKHNALCSVVVIDCWCAITLLLIIAPLSWLYYWLWNQIYLFAIGTNSE